MSEKNMIMISKIDIMCASSAFLFKYAFIKVKFSLALKCVIDNIEKG